MEAAGQRTLSNGRRKMPKKVTVELKRRLGDLKISKSRGE
jgi:hypothetical protein